MDTQATIASIPFVWGQCGYDVTTREEQPDDAYITQMPPELVALVMEFLPLSDVVAMGSTCVVFHGHMVDSIKYRLAHKPTFVTKLTAYPFILYSAGQVEAAARMFSVDSHHLEFVHLDEPVTPERESILIDLAGEFTRTTRYNDVVLGGLLVMSIFARNMSLFETLVRVHSNMATNNSKQLFCVDVSFIGELAVRLHLCEVVRVLSRYGYRLTWWTHRCPRTRTKQQAKEMASVFHSCERCYPHVNMLWPYVGDIIEYIRTHPGDEDLSLFTARKGVPLPISNDLLTDIVLSCGSGDEDVLSAVGRCSLDHVFKFECQSSMGLLPSTIGGARKGPEINPLLLTGPSRLMYGAKAGLLDDRDILIDLYQSVDDHDEYVYKYFHECIVDIIADRICRLGQLGEAVTFHYKNHHANAAIALIEHASEYLQPLIDQCVSLDEIAFFRKLHRARVGHAQAIELVSAMPSVEGKEMSSEFFHNKPLIDALMDAGALRNEEDYANHNHLVHHLQETAGHIDYAAIHLQGPVIHFHTHFNNFH